MWNILPAADGKNEISDARADTGQRLHRSWYPGSFVPSLLGFHVGGQGAEPLPLTL